MFSASVTTRPLKRSSSRNSPVVMRGESEAGTSVSGSSAGRARWPVITLITPLSMAARNGTSSSESSRARRWGRMGRAACESVAVSPWPGKCLAVAITPPSCAPLTKALDHLGDEVGPLAVGADVDDRVARVVVDVGDRSEDLVDAERARLLGRRVARRVGVVRVARGTEGHRPRHRRGSVDAHPRAPLHVLRDEQRMLRARLEVVSEDGLLHRVALEKDDAAHAEALDQVNQALVRRIVVAFEVGVGVRGEKLRDLFFERHPVQRRRHPRFYVGHRLGRPPSGLQRSGRLRQQRRLRGRRAGRPPVPGLAVQRGPCPACK